MSFAPQTVSVETYLFQLIQKLWVIRLLVKQWAHVIERLSSSGHQLWKSPL